MMFWIVRWWRKWQRNVDLEILWPVCKTKARNLEDAREAFLLHAKLDPAWQDMSEQEVLRMLR
jgi:hypothetical protein